MWSLIQVFKFVRTEEPVQPELLQVTPTVRMAGGPDQQPAVVDASTSKPPLRLSTMEVPPMPTFQLPVVRVRRPVELRGTEPMVRLRFFARRSPNWYLQVVHSPLIPLWVLFFIVTVLSLRVLCRKKRSHSADPITPTRYAFSLRIGSVSARV